MPNRNKQEYPTSVVAWLKESRNGGFFISGILKMDVEMFEELLERYDNGDPSTVDEIDEGKACIYFSLNFPREAEEPQDLRAGDSFLGSAKLDNPVQGGGKGKGKGRSRRR